MSTKELLAAAGKGDPAACEQVLEENTGLIVSIARRYIGRGVDEDDLFQLGCLGFWKAVQGFDDSYGTCFSTYAVPKIAGEIRRYLRDDRAVKIGRTVHEQGITLYRKREELRSRLNREPTLSELAQATGMEAEEIARIETAMEPPRSLQQEVAEGLTLEGTIAGEESEETMVEHIALRQAVDQLAEKEKMTILLRFFKGLTQQQTARILGVSQVQVSRLERKGVEHLRQMFGP